MENHKFIKHNNKLIIPDDMSIDISTDNILNYSDIATSDTDNLTEELSSILGCFTSQQIKKENDDSDTNIDSDFILKSNQKQNKNDIVKTENLETFHPHTSHADYEDGLFHQKQITLKKSSVEIESQLEQTKNNMLELKIDIYQILQLVNGMKEKLSSFENELIMLKSISSNPIDKSTDIIFEKISELQTKIETNENNNKDNNIMIDTKIENIFNNIVDEKIDNVKKYVDNKISILQNRLSSTKKFIMNKK